MHSCGTSGIVHSCGTSGIVHPCGTSGIVDSGGTSEIVHSHGTSEIVHSCGTSIAQFLPSMEPKPRIESGNRALISVFPKASLNRKPVAGSLHRVSVSLDA